MDLCTTTLSKNAVTAIPRGLLGEWGLGILTKVDGLSVLMDTGPWLRSDWRRISARTFSSTTRGQLLPCKHLIPLRSMQNVTRRRRLFSYIVLCHGTRGELIPVFTKTVRR